MNSYSICGADCEKCPFKEGCGGCAATNGRPFGEECIIASCDRGCDNRGKCLDMACKLKEELTKEFNSLGIEDMERVTELFALKGSFVNLEYTVPCGQTVKLLNDNRIYLGNQLAKKGSDRCYGLAADKNILLVCEYGENGADAQIVVYKRRKI